jgi:alkylhydroperoxidase family enzyme
MTDSTRLLGPPNYVVRAVLGAIGVTQLFNGLLALFAPRTFYDDFPFGRGWVAALPDYNEHLTRDVGSLFLATALILLVAAVRLDRRLVTVALLAYLTFALPHFIYHAFNLEPYGTADAIANTISLALTVLAPAGLLIAMRRRPAAPPARSAAASGNGRIAGVPDSTRSPLARIAFRSSRKRGGTVLDPVRIHAHHPTILAGYAGLELATEKATLVPKRLKHLAELRAGMLAGCEWCLDYGSAISAAADVDPEDLQALPAYRTSDRFDELDRLVLDYASGMSQTPVDVSDELFARLREHLDEAQLVELTSGIAIENYRARFNWAFGLAGQGLSEGAYCLRPEPTAGAATPA